MKFAATILLLVTLLQGAHAAAPIYRCGANGTVYSQTPCAGGHLIESADPRSAAQRAEAQRVSASERKAAAELERERRARERNQEPAAGIESRSALVEPAPKSPTTAKPKKGHAKPKAEGADFVAIEPGSRKKRSRH